MSLETSDPALKEVVNSMPAWASADRVEAEYISGGITNRNYCLRMDGEPFFVRLAGEETEVLGIDRDNERSAVEAAAAAGMGPGVVAFLPDHRMDRGDARAAGGSAAAHDARSAGSLH